MASRNLGSSQKIGFLNWPLSVQLLFNLMAFFVYLLK
jgi:hypothetical protein